MAKEVDICDFKDNVDEEVTIKGWMFNKRGSGKIMFLQLRDGTGMTQGVVFKPDVKEEVFKLADELTPESSVIITGKVTKHPKQEDVYELQVSDIEIGQLVKEEYPISKKEHGPDFLLDNRHLWLRSKRQWAIQRVRFGIINATYEFFTKNGFLKIDTPILTPNACEGTTDLFEIDYFENDSAFLTQSGQLYLEAAIMAHKRVFDFGPVFRAEKSKTRRHLTEFWMCNAEIAYGDLEDSQKVQEELIYYIVQYVLKNNLKDLELLERDIEALKKIKTPFPRLTHIEAVKKLQELGSDIDERKDLGGDDETILTKEYDNPIFVINYPKEIKAFYMKRDPEDQSRAVCSDLLAPEGYGEIIGGGQREDDYDTLVKRIEEFNLPKDVFNWYLDLRKYGSVPHSGFGYGLERLVTWICGIKHVRESIPFPRLLNRLTP